MNPCLAGHWLKLESSIQSCLLISEVMDSESCYSRLDNKGLRLSVLLRGHASLAPPPHGAHHGVSADEPISKTKGLSRLLLGQEAHRQAISLLRSDF